MIVTAIHTAIVMASRMALFEFRLNQHVCFNLARALVSCTCGGEVFIIQPLRSRVHCTTQRSRWRSRSLGLCGHRLLLMPFALTFSSVRPQTSLLLQHDARC